MGFSDVAARLTLQALPIRAGARRLSGHLRSGITRTPKPTPNSDQDTGSCKYCTTGPSFPFSDDAEICHRVLVAGVSAQATSTSDEKCLEFVQAVAADVPAGLPYVRFHVAKLFVAALFIRLGLDAEQISRFFPGVDLPSLAMEYLTLLDGDRLGGWFVAAFDRFEPEARCYLRESGINLSPSGQAT